MVFKLFLLSKCSVAGLPAQGWRALLWVSSNLTPKERWEQVHTIDDNDLGLPHWREQVWRLLLDLSGNALPRPTACACSDVAIPDSLCGHHHERQVILPDGDAS
jgi:hypothetical protein